MKLRYPPYLKSQNATSGPMKPNPQTVVLALDTFYTWATKQYKRLSWVTEAPHQATFYDYSLEDLKKELPIKGPISILREIEKHYNFTMDESNAIWVFSLDYLLCKPFDYLIKDSKFLEILVSEWPTGSFVKTVKYAAHFNQGLIDDKALTLMRLNIEQMNPYQKEEIANQTIEELDSSEEL